MARLQAIVSSARRSTAQSSSSKRRRADRPEAGSAPGEIERLIPAGAVIATNTSALSITKWPALWFRQPGGRALIQPGSQIGSTCRRSRARRTIAAINEVAANGEETVLVREAPGFITSRVNA
jgi:hypothetical protein